MPLCTAKLSSDRQTVTSFTSVLARMTRCSFSPPLMVVELITITFCSIADPEDPRSASNVDSIQLLNGYGS